MGPGTVRGHQRRAWPGPGILGKSGPGTAQARIVCELARRD